MNKLKMKKMMQLMLSFAVIAATVLFTNPTPRNIYADTPDLLPLIGNHLKNPTLQYKATDTTIDGWNIEATNYIIKGAVKSTIGSQGSTTGYRQLKPITGTQNFSGFEFINDNTKGPLKIKTAETDHNKNYAKNESFTLLSQTLTLVQGYKYYF